MRSVRTNGINELPCRGNVKIQQRFSVNCTISLAFIDPLKMCNWHSVISLASLENDIARETAQTSTLSIFGMFILFEGDFPFRISCVRS